MIINRKWAMPNSNTFSILPIRELVDRYTTNEENQVIVDPFANNCGIGTITNDLNPKFNTTYHLDALDFLKMLAILIIVTAYFISWAVTIGIIYLICLCFGIEFKLLIATGIWLIMCILQSIFKKRS